MLKRKYRLPGVVFNTGRSFLTQLFLIKVMENGLGLNRFRITVSKKIDKRAVVRNRIKRLISSCIEELYNDMKQGYDMLFIVKRFSIGKTREEFRGAIKDVLQCHPDPERSEGEGSLAAGDSSSVSRRTQNDRSVA